MENNSNPQVTPPPKGDTGGISHVHKLVSNNACGPASARQPRPTPVNRRVPVARTTRLG